MRIAHAAVPSMLSQSVRRLISELVTLVTPLRVGFN